MGVATFGPEWKKSSLPYQLQAFSAPRFDKARKLFIN
jgi:hypothetical protein